MGIGEILTLVLVGIQVANALFGKKEEQQTTQKTEEMPKGYQSPFMGIADLYTLMGGARRNAAYEGWGWPEGQGPTNPFGSGFMESLMSAWPDVLSAYTGSKTRMPINPAGRQTRARQFAPPVSGGIPIIPGRAPLI